MKRSLFLMLLVFASLVLGCKGMSVVAHTPTPPPPTAEQPAATAVAVATATPLPATPAPIVVTATPSRITPPTATPKPRQAVGRSTPTPTPTMPGLWLFDDFENPDNNGSFDKGLWHQFDDLTTVEQKDGVLMISRQSPSSGGLYYGPLKIGELGFVEAKVMLDGNIEASLANVGIQIYTNSHDLWLECAIGGAQQNSNALANCQTNDGYGTNGVIVPYNSWHIMRFEVDPATGIVSFFVDSQLIGSYSPPDPEAFKQTPINVWARVWSEDDGLVTGYIDDVRVGKAQAAEASAVDPALYDDFNDEQYEGTFDPEKWAVEKVPAQIGQQNGEMVFTLVQPTPNDVAGLHLIQPETWTLDQFQFVEARLRLSSETVIGGNGNIALALDAPLKNNHNLGVQCYISRQEPIKVKCFAGEWNEVSQMVEYTDIGFKLTGFDVWHTVRIEVDPEVNYTFYIDGEKLGSYKPNAADAVKDGPFAPGIWIWSETQDSIKAYIDDVRIGRLGQ